MIAAARMLKAGIVIAAVVLSGVLAGCVGDSGINPAMTSQTSGETTQLRYYGGPKSPMWPAR